MLDQFLQFLVIALYIMWSINHTTEILQKMVLHLSSFEVISWRQKKPWGVLTLTWYTYMCLLLGCFFTKFGLAIRGFHQRGRSPNYTNWVYLGQIIVKSTQFGQNWVHFFRKWYTDGWEIRQKNGIEKVRFLTSGRHIHVRF